MKYIIIISSLLLLSCVSNNPIIIEDRPTMCLEENITVDEFNNLIYNNIVDLNSYIDNLLLQIKLKAEHVIVNDKVQ